MPANRQNNSNFFNYSALIDSTSQRTTAAQNDGVRTAVTAATAVDTTASPPNAINAPTKGTNNALTGLCDALNQYQKDLVKKGTYEIADVYEINFAPASIGASKVTKPGPITYKNTAPKNINTAADKTVPETDQVNTESQIWSVLAGTQIVQLIDQIMRSSTYITGQQKVNFDVDGKQTKNSTAGSGGVTAWYKISLTTRQLGYDKKRRDNAYRMTFTISPYAINQMASPYFPDSNYRGAHKEFNYWFTGMNTQVLSYEQEYNQAYYTTLSGNPSGLAVPPPKGRDQFKQTHMATSEQRGQGQANYVNEPADSAAAFLYSVSDFAEVRMKIVGDPAWMQQGEAAFGVNASTFEFHPFNSDGGINFDSQEVTFTVSFNRPTDYNFNTGIMNVNSADGSPQEKFAYIAKTVKNTFSKGVFTQELVGSLLPLENTSSAASTNGRAPTGLLSTAPDIRSTGIPQAQADAQDLENGANAGTGTGDTNSGFYNDAEYNGPQTTQPASAPGAPTSSGDVAPADTPAPQNANTTDKVLANEEETAAVNAYVAAGGTFPRGTGPITSGPLFDNVVAAKASLTARQQAAGSATTSAPPQQIAKDDS